MLTPEDIAAARKRIEPYIHRTPLVYSPTFSTMTGCEVYLKLETLQKAGSFKVRGAVHSILQNREAISKGGVVAASAGNHAQGVAIAAGSAGTRATIVMPAGSSVAKQEATRGYGAEIVLAGRNLEESIRYAGELEKRGLFFIHPYDDPNVIAGAGTIGCEILSDLPGVDYVIVPVGGGGLIAGIATAIKGVQEKTRIIGVQSDASDAAYQAFTFGSREAVSPGRTIADGIAVPVPGRESFTLMKKYVDWMYTVTEEEMIQAILLLLERKHLVVEGAGSAALAFLLSGKAVFPPASRIVLVLSGGNIDLGLLSRVMHQAQLRRDRAMWISVVISDSPGSLARMLGIIADTGGNIMDLIHKRDEKGLHPTEIRVEIEIETRGADHQQRIRSMLAGAGYALR
ncbi:MAG: threonine ammonia-lyase [Methanocalculus sp. MSAO_Arc1]|uniref:threonine ammonia-lyase n=1 Tax=Methanocalculus TaxID=71151 RepID=UPI000FF3FBA4|nr:MULTISPECIES: threonine ammonia-lyase [unclassified Methanocalculus]MCP1662438.1 threonine dehydratase [Methanocalculus sp. AMF5]RQD79499.1 MAG: threonine ammonia-lyase [Methanocalculus sp. MSAO_Arc1]